MKLTTTFLQDLATIGNSFVSLTYVSEVKIKKNDIITKADKVTKETKLINLQVGANYENAVNNHLASQGQSRDFTALSLPWGEWEIVNKLIAHKEKKYVRFYKCANTKTESITYFVNGTQATAEQIDAIEQYRYKSSHFSGTQAASGLTTYQVQPFNVESENIISLTMNGTIYQ